MNDKSKLLAAASSLLFRGVGGGTDVFSRRVFDGGDCFADLLPNAAKATIASTTMRMSVPMPLIDGSNVKKSASLLWLDKAMIMRSGFVSGQEIHRQAPVFLVSKIVVVVCLKRFSDPDHEATLLLLLYIFSIRCCQIAKTRRLKCRP